MNISAISTNAEIFNHPINRTVPGGMNNPSISSLSLHREQKLTKTLNQLLLQRHFLKKLYL